MLPRNVYSGAVDPARWDDITDSKQVVSLNPKLPLKSTSLNWDLQPAGAAEPSAPVLTPHDVIQVAFLLEQEAGVEGSHEETDDGRRVLGQLAIQWRSALGDQGSLSTGWLTSRR
jgi:hypothetical protein